jgi:hypothetical protein
MKTSDGVNGSMLFTSHDIDVIVRGLRTALEQEEDRRFAEELREVLNKLRDSASNALQQVEPSVHADDRWLGQLGDD